VLVVARVRLYLAVVAAVVAGLVLASARQALALPLYVGNVGNFQLSADTIEGKDFDLALALDPDSGPEGGTLPVGGITLGRATIDGLVLEKQFDLGKVLGTSAGGPWKLRLATAGRTTLTGLRLDAAGICANSFDFGPGFAVNGKGAGTATPTDDFSLGADTITLRRPAIEATSLSTQTITIAGLRIGIEQSGYDRQPCVAAAR
jgi:hypothetical protein